MSSRNGDVSASIATKASRPKPGRTARDGRRENLLKRLGTLHSLSVNSVALLAVAFILLLHLCALTLFSRGFLLSRTTLEKRNLCNVASRDCTLTPKFDRAIILLIDALRYDFLLPADPTLSSFDGAHHNHLTLPGQLTARWPEHSLLFKGVADPPTTTLQRLKALTTGSLPTFVDAGSNFAGSAVEEDNWLEQANRAGKRIAFMGDDTWLTIFPEAIFAPNLSFPFDSFNVEDLDTVDRGVRKHIIPLLDEPAAGSSWDILIAHPLGLDHAGHRFGASHAETSRKLDEMNALLLDVVDRLATKDLLIVLGDHGMDSNGNHGGDSPDETDAGLWIYSKTALTPSNVLDIQPFRQSSSTLTSLLGLAPDGYAEFFQHHGTTTRSVSQISLIPTLCLLLGIPIPLNNLGTVIPELFVETTTASLLHRAVHGPSTNQLLQAMRINAMQIRGYIEEYTSSKTGSDLAPFAASLQDAYQAASAEGTEAAEFVALRHFTFSVLRVTRGIWARFDAKLMLAGVVVLFGSLIAIWRFYCLSRQPGPLYRKGVLRAALAQGTSGAVIGLTCGVLALLLSRALSTQANLSSNIVIFGTSIGGLAGILSYRKDAELESPATTISTSDYLAVAQILLHSIMFASNSYTMWEDRVVLYLVQMTSLVLVIQGHRAYIPLLRLRIIRFAVLSMMLHRFIAFSTICREEQHPYCSATFYGRSGVSTASGSAFGLAILAAIFLPTITARFLDIAKSRQGWASFILRYSFRSLLLAGVLYWIAEYFEHEGTPSQVRLLSTFRTTLARSQLLCCLLLGSTFWATSPVCVSVIEQTFEKEDGQTSTKVSVIGFANAAGASYLLVFIALFSGIFLLAQPVGQFIYAIGLVALLSFLEANDSNRDAELLLSRAQGKMPPLEVEGVSVRPDVPPSLMSICYLVLWGFNIFFATGHQAVLSSIQWKAAFIGFPVLTYPFSPILVILNTLGPFILSAASVPLLVFWNTSPTMKNGPSMPVLTNILKASFGFMFYHTSTTLATAAFAAHLRRHLMVWKVFAPRFMLSAITLLAVDATLLLFAVGWGTLGTLRKLKTTFGSAWC
ncbi:mannose-ethanolamine phosphotransferase gpi13 [Cystobasidiomycetes sp. EMM_F5]